MSASLTARDLRAILGAIPRLYAPTTPDAFPRQAMDVVCEILPVGYISYDEVDPVRGVIRNELNREPPMPYDVFVSGWEEHAHEHPIINYVRAGGKNPVVTISDFLTLREFRNTGLYKACFRPGGMTHQIGLQLPAPDRVVGMGITRDKDFDQRERAIIEVLRPHMAQARMNSFFFASTHEAVSREEMVLQRDSDGAVLIWPHRIQLILASYYDCQYRGRWGPPRALLDWMAAHLARIKAGDVRPDAFAPLVVRRPTKYLTIRFFYTTEQQPFLTFEEQADPTGVDPLQYVAIGLTTRESEILTWVAAGKRDAEIAQILGGSPRTVSNHIYRILRKLRVETRTAAVAEADFRLRQR